VRTHARLQLQRKLNRAPRARSWSPRVQACSAPSGPGSASFPCCCARWWRTRLRCIEVGV